ncbi:MAG TPA: glycosyltransferase family 39 protein [Candidatus Binataceae bacterium]
MRSGESEGRASPRWLPASLDGCSERNLLAIVTLSALAIRLYLTFTSYCISGDGVAYVGIARNLAAGNTAKALASVFPPLYPWLISIVHLLVPDWEIAGQLISSLLGAAAVVPVYYLVREVFARRDFAAGAAILTAIHPDLAQYSASVRTEAGYITMIVAAVLLTLMAIRRQRLGWFAGAGLLYGIAYWYRTEAIGMPVVSAGFLIVGALWWREWRLGWSIAAAAYLVAAFLIVAAPFLIYLNSTSDHFVVSRELKAAVMYGMGDVSNDKNTWQLRGYSPHTSIWAPLQVAPARYLRKVGGDLLMSPYFYAEALGPMLTLFLVIGLVNRGGSMVRNYGEAFLASVTLFYVFGFAASYTGPRFLLHLIPFAFGWVMVGIAVASGWIAALDWRGVRMPAGALAALVAIVLLPRTLRPIGYDQRAFRDAGADIARGDAHHGVVVSRDKRAAFYAGTPDLYLPIDPKPNLCGWLAGQPGVAYLMLTDKEEHQLSVNSNSTCITLVKRYPRGSGYYDLFEIRK